MGEGEVMGEGKPTDICSPKDAMRLGIEAICQYNSMVPIMSIARNIFIWREPLRFSIGGIGILYEAKMRADGVSAIAAVDLQLRSPDALVGDLLGGRGKASPSPGPCISNPG